MNEIKSYELIYLSRIKGYQLNLGFIDANNLFTAIKSSFHATEQGAKFVITRWLAE